MKFMLMMNAPRGKTGIGVWSTGHRRTSRPTSIS